MARHLQGEPPALWDPVVRLSHWAIAVIVVVNGLLDHGGGVLHVWLGWIGGAVLVLRLVWALIGPPEARFSAFPPRPRWALDHLRHLLRGQPPAYRSHNPAGALMVYALWGLLAVVIGTGLWMTDFATPMAIQARQATIESGDWSTLAAQPGGGGEGDGGGEHHEGHLLGEVHSTAANLMLILAVLHLAGVTFESVALRRNLVKPMLLGQDKRS